MAILSTVLPEEDPAAKKRVELQMTNLLFLLRKMYDTQPQTLFDQLKLTVPILPDENVAAALLRLLKFPPCEKMKNIALVVLGQCVLRSKYSILIDIMQKHQLIKSLISFLKFTQAQPHVMTLLQFFLIGFQVSPAVFHSVIPELLKICELVIKAPATWAKFAQDLAELLVVLMRTFPGYPVQYTPLVNALKELINRHHLVLPSESRMNEVKVHTSWLNLTQQMGGSCPSNLTYTYNVSQNTSGYKGLANAGNST